MGLKILMTCLRPDLHSLSDHPLEVLNQPAAGYILDLVSGFQHSFQWRFDQDVLQGLLFLALQHAPVLGIFIRDDDPCSLGEALIWRLQVAGDLAEDDQGFRLTPQGEERRCSTFHDALTAPAWSQVLERVQDDVATFAETEGVPLTFLPPASLGHAKGWQVY